MDPSAKRWSNNARYALFVVIILLLLLGFAPWFASVQGQNSTSTTLPTTTTFASKTLATTTTSSISSSTSTTRTNRSLIPVIFIPGVAGSYLYANGVQAWPFPTGNVINLSLRADGVTPTIPRVNVSATDILRFFGFANFYGGMISYLGTQGYRLNRTLFLFPYDWRLDLSSDLPKLDQVIQTALSRTNQSQVLILAHSMGGLIAEAYVISSATRAAKVASIITMGTPFWGAPKAFYTVVNGYTFGNPYVTQRQMKFMAQNMTTVYELLPQVPFINASGTMLSLSASYGMMYKKVIQNLSCPSCSPTLSTANVWRFNPGRYNASVNFWASLGTKASPAKMPVPLYTIIGDGFQTLSGYNLRRANPNESAIQLGNGTRIVLTPVFRDGDGTVPLWSAQISTATRTYYIANVPGTTTYGITTGAVSSGHADLPSNPTVQQIVGRILNGSAPPSQTYSVPSSMAGNSENFILHSNAELSVSAANGVLSESSSGRISENLSSGTFLDEDGVEYAAVEDTSNVYLIQVTGTSTGEFSLTVNITLGNFVDSFVYPQVQVQNGTVAKVSINASQIASQDELPALTVNEVNGSQRNVLAINNIASSTNSGTGTMISTTPTSPTSMTVVSVTAISTIIVAAVAIAVIFFVRRKLV